MRLAPPLALAGPLLLLLPAASSPSPPIPDLDHALGPAPSYGVDVSFPVHHVAFRDGASPLGDGPRRAYEEFVAGCRTRYSKGCDYAERDRVAMGLREPALMRNYTDTGWKVAEVPPDIFGLLKDFYETHLEGKKVENNGGNLFVNHWTSPTYMVDVEASPPVRLRGGGRSLKQRVWDGVRPVLEEWTGVELAPAFMYGIRQYTAGAVLSPHVDRKPFIISVIVNVAQDVDEDWPLEVYGRDGLAHNVTTVPGEMVLYESHSLIHGRPFPLRGRSFANLLINFTPTGKVLRGRDAPVRGGNDEARNDESPRRRHAPRRTPARAKTEEAPAVDAAPHGSLARAAAAGDIDRMLHFSTNYKYLLHNKDANGWQPIHEAARGGHTDVVRLLVEHGADVNERTGFGEGRSLLEIVRDHHGDEHPLFGYLEGLGAEL